jgi:hypothetical protein
MLLKQESLQQHHESLLKRFCEAELRGAAKGFCEAELRDAAKGFCEADSRGITTRVLTKAMIIGKSHDHG